LQIIQKTLESISHIDTYYTLFNDFISENIELLETNNLGVFVNAWKRILSFQNKLKWLHQKYVTTKAYYIFALYISIISQFLYVLIVTLRFFFFTLLKLKLR